MADQTQAQLQEIYSTFGTQDFQQRWVAQDWTLKDKVGYAAVNAFNFFAQPAGANDPNLAVQKKREQANFGTPGAIGGDYFFIVQKIRLFVQNSAKVRQSATAAADTQFSARQLQYARLHSAITSQGVFVWTVNQRKILTENQPWCTFAPGFGLGEVKPPSVGFTDGDPAAINGGANAFAMNSRYDIDGGQIGDPFALAPIVVLAPSTTFNIDILNPVGNFPSPANVYGTSGNQTAVIWLCCYLDGQKVRPRS